ncbi:MAG: S8 family serine peptidase, partial [Thalassolituus sp.]
MRIFWYLCSALLLLLPCRQVLACALPLDNFGKTYCLIEHTDGGYQVSGLDVRVVLSNRIIVRASGLNRDVLKTLDARIQSVSELYLLTDSTYYLVTLSSADVLAAVVNTLRSARNITLVQPDLLLLREKHASGAEGVVSYESEEYTTANSSGSSSEYFRQLNIESLWKNTSGKGVSVAIIDDGFALDHTEFSRVSIEFSYDAESHTQNVNPRSADDSHGTRVTGVIFAVHDGKGIDGIAPAAGLIALRQPDTWTSQTLLSFYLSKLSHADIINASWGSPWL